ncbi:myo-inositol transporter Itr1 [Schizosaccharomyces japonicus yFS275]|uniref:Myo-inositol transporter Itr1 n=1 Tax=Schizosaccharomyces japonicus (strain yFS275 / FY16936) TaxID=402676 RepID=B6K704_SCHJY|nr:myo-inositol transporter Itr1 [Schizosaccharomyces japonicus yFS275]EEB09308.1 myo-inositol transporter Itr1 [Schizosaccharomyces japonicus yFS275]
MTAFSKSSLESQTALGSEVQSSLGVQNITAIPIEKKAAQETIVDVDPFNSAVSVHHPRRGRADSDASFSSLESRTGLNDSIEYQRVSKWIWVLALAAGISGLLFGYDTGVISGALVVINKDLGHTLSYGDKEFITSATSLGALMGGVIAGTLADFMGRRPVISVGAVIIIVGSIVQVTAHGLWHMIVGRFVIGWGVGLASLIVPLYLSELAPAKFRSRLVIVYVLMITLGQVIAYAIDAAFEYHKAGWRWMVGLAIVPAVIQIFVMLWLPESPRFLVKREHKERARKIISKIYPEAHPYEVENKIRLIQEGVRDPFTGTRFQRFVKSAKELFLRASNLRSLFIACALQGMQQLSGFNSLMYFSSTIFEIVGFHNPIATGLIIAGTNFIFTIIAFVVVDRLGRRLLLLITMWGMIIGLVVCAIAFHYLPQDSAGNYTAGSSNVWAIIILISMIVYVASYASGLGNLPWQQSELFPMSVRALGSGLATSTNWAGNLAIGATFLTLMNAITPTGTFALYSGICLLGWIIFVFCYPELTDYTIEEIAQLLSSGFNIRKSMAHHREIKRLHAEEEKERQENEVNN